MPEWGKGMVIDGPLAIFLWKKKVLVLLVGEEAFSVVPLIGSWGLTVHSVRLREAIYACMSGTPLLLLADKWVRPKSKHQVFQRKERVTTYWSLSFNWDSLSDNPFEWLPSTLLWFIWNLQSTSIYILPHKK